jgi:hypothetical protein
MRPTLALPLAQAPQSSCYFGLGSATKRFSCLVQHNKRRTELHRLQAKHPEVAARIERQAARAEVRDGDIEDGNNDSETSSSEEEVSFFHPSDFCSKRLVQLTEAVCGGAIRHVSASRWQDFSVVRGNDLRLTFLARDVVRIPLRERKR